VTGNVSGSSGSTTGNAATVTNGVYTNTANSFTTGTQTIATGSDATVGLRVKRNSATQSANIVEVTQSDGSTILAKIDASGNVTSPAVVVAPKGSFTLTGVSASHTGSNSYNTITVSSTVGLYVGQSVTLASLSADFNGTAVVQQITNATSLRVDSALSGSYSASGGTLTASGTQQNLQEWQRTDGTVLTAINPAGGIVTPLVTGIVHANGAGTALTSSLIANADVSSVAGIVQSKLSIQKYMTSLASVVDVHPRTSVTNARSMASGIAYFAAYTPEENIRISNISLSTQVAAVPLSGTNKTQVGIFSVNAGGSKTSSVSCLSFSLKTNTTTTTTAAAFGSAASGTLETFALGYTITNGGAATTNTAPTFLDLVAGTTYWIGVVSYASAGFGTGASVAGINCLSVQMDPYIGLQQTGQGATDFAVSTAITTTTGPTVFPTFRLT
jgi:hypothetical protein